MPQLTITLDDALLGQAQAYAQQHGQHLDALVAELLQAAVQAAPPPRPLSPRVQRLYGALKAPVDFDYRTELGKALEERFEI